MKTALLFFLATCALLAALFLFYRTSSAILAKDYLGALLLLIGAIALSHSATELARLGLLARSPHP